MMLIYKNNDNPLDMWHAHRDNGTVGLWVKGRHFLPAPGPYTYGDETGGSLDQIRAEHQAARNHNTLTLELEDIVKGRSRGTWLTSYSQNGVDCVAAQNASYSNLTHRRIVWMVNKQFYVIADAAFGSCSGRTLNLSWHLCKDNVTIDPDKSNVACGAHTTFPDGNNLYMKTFATVTTGFEAVEGTSYCSEQIGERYLRKFYRINLTKNGTGTSPRFLTVIVPCADASTVSVSGTFKAPFNEHSESVRVSVNGQEYNLAASW